MGAYRMPELFTIGYQGLELIQLGSILTRAGVEVVLDVRDVPWSRFEEYRKGTLREILGCMNIKYAHIKAAGNPRSIRDLGLSSAEELARYREHLRQRPDLVKKIRKGIGGWLYAGRKPCLLCMERNWRTCHRSVVVEFLELPFPDLVVTHLVPER